jgi:hypothetical protein
MRRQIFVEIFLHLSIGLPLSGIGTTIASAITTALEGSAAASGTAAGTATGVSAGPTLEDPLLGEHFMPPEEVLEGIKDQLQEAGEWLNRTLLNPHARPDGMDLPVGSPEMPEGTLLKDPTVGADDYLGQSTAKGHVAERLIQALVDGGAAGDQPLKRQDELANAESWDQIQARAQLRGFKKELKAPDPSNPDRGPWPRGALVLQKGKAVQVLTEENGTVTLTTSSPEFTQTISWKLGGSVVEDSGLLDIRQGPLGWSPETLARYGRYPHAEPTYRRMAAALVEMEAHFPELKGLVTGPGVFLYDPADPVATLNALGVPKESIVAEGLSVSASILKDGVLAEVRFTRASEDAPFTKLEATVKDPPDTGFSDEANLSIGLVSDLEAGSFELYATGKRPMAAVEGHPTFWEVPERFQGVLGTEDARELVLNTREGAHEVLQRNGLSLRPDGSAFLSTSDEDPTDYFLFIEDPLPSYGSVSVTAPESRFKIKVESNLVRNGITYRFKAKEHLKEVKHDTLQEPQPSAWDGFIPKGADGKLLPGALFGPQDLLDPVSGKLLDWSVIETKLSGKWTHWSEDGIEKYKIDGKDGVSQLVSRDPWLEVTFQASRPKKDPLFEAAGLGPLKGTVYQAHAFRGDSVGITKIWSDTMKETQKLGLGNLGGDSGLHPSVGDWAQLVSAEPTAGGLHFTRGATTLDAQPELVGTPLAFEVTSLREVAGADEVQLFRNDVDATFLVERKLSQGSPFASAVTIWNDAGEKLGQGFIDPVGRFFWET